MCQIRSKWSPVQFTTLVLRHKLLIEAAIAIHYRIEVTAFESFYPAYRVWLRQVSVSTGISISPSRCLPYCCPAITARDSGTRRARDKPDSRICRNSPPIPALLYLGENPGPAGTPCLLIMVNRTTRGLCNLNYHQSTTATARKPFRRSKSGLLLVLTSRTWQTPRKARPDQWLIARSRNHGARSISALPDSLMPKGTCLSVKGGRRNER